MPTVYSSQKRLILCYYEDSMDHAIERSSLGREEKKDESRAKSEPVDRERQYLCVVEWFGFLALANQRRF